jgi:hypothetical protein
MCRVPRGYNLAVFTENPQHLGERETKVREKVPLVSLPIDLSDHHEEEHVRHNDSAHGDAERDDENDDSCPH